MTGWNLPPGVTGREPHLTGDYPCEKCDGAGGECDPDGGNHHWTCPRCKGTGIEPEVGEVRINATADSLSLETDERGFELHATTDEGDEIVLNIHGVAFEFAASDGLRSLLDWWREGESVRQLVGQTTVDELLAADDPKSEGYVDRMREGADLARKAERES